MRVSWRFFTPVRIALVVGLVFAVLRFQNPLFLHLLDVRLMDFRLLQRGPVEPLPQVVIVAVDDESVAKVGRWVWPRAILANLFRRISAASPRVIALDIVFSESSEFQDREGLTARPEGISPQEWSVTQETLRAQDRVLADAIKESGRVVLGYALDFAPEATQPGGRALTIYNLVRGKQRGANKIPSANGAIVNLPEIEGPRCRPVTSTSSRISSTVRFAACRWRFATRTRCAFRSRWRRYRPPSRIRRSSSSSTTTASVISASVPSTFRSPRTVSY